MMLKLKNSKISNFFETVSSNNRYTEREINHIKKSWNQKIQHQNLNLNNKIEIGWTMADKNNLQDIFLNHIRKNKISVTVFLVNGVKLQGSVTWFDNLCVLLRRDAYTQLVYKHAISTIMPLNPVKLFDTEDDADLPSEA